MPHPRPPFAIAWTKFTEIYGDGSLTYVGNKIGGIVKENFDLGQRDPALGFTNACATRMSYVLNYSGVPIHKGPWTTVSGGDKKLYIFRVADMMKFLRGIFGNPDKTVQHPSQENFYGERGFLAFEVHGWIDATGHITLWNGSICSDHCYFPKASQAFLWRLS